MSEANASILTDSNYHAMPTPYSVSGLGEIRDFAV
jgi:hypothetical protein